MYIWENLQHHFDFFISLNESYSKQVIMKIIAQITGSVSSKLCNQVPLQAGIEFKKNLRGRFGKYGGLKLEYFWNLKSKKAKSFIRC